MPGKGHIIREKYEATAGGYDELYGEEQAEKYFVALRRYPPRGAVLDAGCGTGLLIEYLASRGLLDGVERYVCLDYSWAMLSRAEERRRRLCPRKCMSVLGNVMSLPFPDDSFDIVYSFTVLDLVDSVSRALRELQRVSRGPVVVSMLKTLPYKDLLVLWGARLVGVTSKDAVFEASSAAPG